MMKIERTYMLIHLLSSALTPLLPFINIYFMARIINIIVDNGDIYRLIAYVIIAISLSVVLILTINALTIFKQYHLDQFYKNEKMLFSKKTMEIDYDVLENYDTKMLYERIQIENQSGHNSYFLYTFVGKFLSNIITVIMAVLITREFFFIEGIGFLHIILTVIIIVMVVVINSYSNFKINDFMLSYFDKCVDTSARLNFYYNFLRDYKVGKDVRLYGMEDYLLDIQKKDDTFNNNLIKKTKLKCLWFTLAHRITTDLLSISAFIFFAILCFYNQISVGDIMKYISSFILLINGTSEAVVQIQSLLNNNKYLKNYIKYLEIPTAQKGGTQNIYPNGIDEIFFDNVTFKYPGNSHSALNNFSYRFIRGKKISIVGMNGSGKTTIIKLLCRLYEPTSGTIYINGINVKQIDFDQYMGCLGVVFQDFKLFSFGLAQNIASKTSYCEKKVYDSLKKIGLDEWKDDLPYGIETYLYKDFDDSGIELSGGEAQKLAIARALYKNAEFIVLDEPTAALDPMAESEIYHQINEMADNRAVIFISHRLSACLFSDEIIVMHNGTLIQKGSHDSLVLDKSEKYFELWSSQQHHYL